MNLYAILNTEKQRLFFVDESKKKVMAEFNAYRENGDQYQFVTITMSMLKALDTCRKAGSLIDERLRSRYPYTASEHFIDRKVIKSLADKQLASADGDYWRINENGERVHYVWRSLFDDHDTHGVTPGDLRHIEVR
jgi:hypothetical protein